MMVTVPDLGALINPILVIDGGRGAEEGLGRGQEALAGFGGWEFGRRQ